jgi:hypothetical protein
MGSDSQLSFFPVTDKPDTSAANNSITVPEHKRKKKRTHSLENLRATLYMTVMLHTMHYKYRMTASASHGKY